MPTLKDEGICIRHWDWSETSQTVSVFTREHGIIRGLAKGARREGAKFSGGLELATRGEIVAILKAQESDHSLANLTAWDLQEVFNGVRQSLAGFTVAMGMLDLVQHAMIERDPHPELYDALVSGLRRLEREGEAVHAALGVAWSTVDNTGHRPELFVDALDGAALPSAGLYGFDPKRGVVLADPGEHAASVWRVRGETIEVLRSLSRGEVVQPGKFSKEACGRALKLLCFYFRELAGKQPPALRAMLESVTNGP